MPHDCVRVNKGAWKQLSDPKRRRAKKLLLVPSNFSFFHQTNKMFERTIVSSFGISGKTTAGELTALQVILQALTTEAFSGTRFVAAIALLQIFFLLALHRPALNVLQRSSLSSLQIATS